VTLAPLKQYGAAALVGTIAGAFLFFLVAAGREPDLFMQQRQLAACVGGAMAVAMIFAHLWRPAY
jgi:Mg/Co/Ni transporter MgtE